MSRQRAFFCHPLRLSLTLAGAAALFLASAACGGDAGGDPGKVQVVTTLPLFADFVRNVGGDRVEVTSLVPSGADPHTWEPSPSDARKVADADIAFANGLDLEPAAIKLIQANLKDGARFVRLALELGPVVKLPPTPDHDPHLWLEPTPVKRYVEIVRDALRQADPEGANTYEVNGKEYLEALGVTFEDISQTIESVSAENRKLVTTHDAFRGFANAFGLRIVAVVADSPGQEPSPEDVADIVRVIEDQNVPAVFREPQIDAEGRILEQAAKDAGVEVCTLYSDSLDDKVKSYIDMMRFNADEIARCLGGESGG